MGDIFFRFPLRILSGFASPSERLDQTIGYCVMDVGKKTLENAGNAEVTMDQ
ncbi:MAG: hypothetical protein JNJ83_10665 [Verrucomicrobiaceae bacterium]|nr:hypothetical protein [Verrucomicrobiaceae bacterium]